MYVVTINFRFGLHIMQQRLVISRQCDKRERSAGSHVQYHSGRLSWAELSWAELSCELSISVLSQWTLLHDVHDVHSRGNFVAACRQQRCSGWSSYRTRSTTGGGWCHRECARNFIHQWSRDDKTRDYKPVECSLHYSGNFARQFLSECWNLYDSTFLSYCGQLHTSIVITNKAPCLERLRHAA